MKTFGKAGKYEKILRGKPKMKSGQNAKTQEKLQKRILKKTWVKLAETQVNLNNPGKWETVKQCDKFLGNGYLNKTLFLRLCFQSYL